ncbi:trp operon leader peptide [Salmonella enterica]|nr:trp operon leader peptide [Salmonella enterica subsp. enterica]EHT1013006.1 trp operon leader peptide [Salmonella enterica]
MAATFALHGWWRTP